jgi:23S rRNA (cytidine2498-2'-O)-methyltransferase
MMKKAEFVFATCRAGSEAALKREVAARHGAWLTPAYMRPQLITWKARTEMPADFELGAAYACVSGWSAGRATSSEEVLSLLNSQSLSVANIHVFPRRFDEDDAMPDVWAKIEIIHHALAAAIPKIKASPFILDVILGEEGEPWFIGIHRRTSAAHPSPGALPRVSIPASAPSRAWSKMEQSLTWLGLDKSDTLRGQTALELGSAPGGAAWALLERGMNVIGVDTGQMDERVLVHPSYTHISLPAGDVSLRSLPKQVDLIASDMNVHPGLAVKYIEHFTRCLSPRYLVLTLKMNNAQVESEIPALLQQVRRFAPGEVYARQLPANRSEITVISR